MNESYKEEAIKALSAAITKATQANSDALAMLKNLSKIVHTNGLTWRHKEWEYQIVMTDDEQSLKIKVDLPVVGVGTAHDPITVIDQ